MSAHCLFNGTAEQCAELEYIVKCKYNIYKETLDISEMSNVINIVREFKKQIIGPSQTI